jgi:hypothetical protein
MYIWKLWEIVSAEGSPDRIIDKARQASISALWVKVADGETAFRNVGPQVAPDLQALVACAHANNIEIWGWQVPHCDSVAIAKKEAKALNLYFPLNFRAQTDSEAGFKPLTKRFMKLARLPQVPSRFEKWRASPRFYVLRADIHCR